MEIDGNSTIRTLVAGDYRLAEVFRRHGIDFCRPGDQTISEVVGKMGLAEEILIRELKEAVLSRDPELDLLRRLPPYELVSHIIEYHHGYVRNTAPQISGYLKILANDHGSGFPELIEVSDLFELAVHNLSHHLEKEELVLFPRIRRIYMHSAGDQDTFEEDRLKIDTCISELMESREQDIQRFRRMAMLTCHYQVPEGMCNTWQITMKNLREFDEDLRRHFHLENDILFPKVLRLE